MSHFFTVAILPKETPIEHVPVMERLNKMLAPFDENTEVDPYKEDCYCIEGGKPDQKCDDCHGSGKSESTYNPESKWDWWRIGGRWNGDIQGESKGDGDGYNFGEEFQQLKPNVIPVSELLKDKGALNDRTPFAVITPEGEWAERGKMGWWGAVHNGKDRHEWAKTVHRIYEKYPDHIAVGLDLHI